MSFIPYRNLTLVQMAQARVLLPKRTEQEMGQFEFYVRDGNVLMTPGAWRLRRKFVDRVLESIFGPPVRVKTDLQDFKTAKFHLGQD